MMQESNKNQPASDGNQPAENKPVSQPNDQHLDDDQHSYPGQLDQVEGNMHNGEIGGGLKKEEEG
jgi:hypothetical protein